MCNCSINIITVIPITPQSANIGGYRYFFNGQEGDNEVFGIREFQNCGFSMYDTR